MAALRCLMLNIQQRAEEFEVGGIAQSPLTAMAWQHLMAQCAINISTQELNSSRRARVQEELKH